MSFPADAFDADVTLLDVFTTDPSAKYIPLWAESTVADHAFPIANMSDMQYTIQVSNEPLLTENISYVWTLPIPPTVPELCPINSDFDFFVFDEQHEAPDLIWPMIRLVDTAYNATQQSLTVEISPRIWANRTAILFIGCTDHSSLPRRRRLGRRHRRRRRRILQSQSLNCDAVPIQSPLERDLEVVRAFDAWEHVGVDYRVDGDAILAVADGTVLECGESAFYGPWIVLEHQGGVTTYKHIRECAVNQDDLVLVGQVIGYAYNDSFLHLELVGDGSSGVKARVDPHACSLWTFSPTTTFHPTPYPTVSNNGGNDDGNNGNDGGNNGGNGDSNGGNDGGNNSGNDGGSNGGNNGGNNGGSNSDHGGSYYPSKAWDSSPTSSSYWSRSRDRYENSGYHPKPVRPNGWSKNDKNGKKGKKGKKK